MRMRESDQWVGPSAPMPEIKTPLKVGIVPTPDFTLMSFTCLVEYLRLAADESDFSRQVYCSWSVISSDQRPIQSSSGLSILPTAHVSTLGSYDVLVLFADRP